MSLRPLHALLHPLWLASLALLVLNDHVLKRAAGGVVTGKLSDLAGLVVAPVLLALLVGVRTERGLAWAHVAVGAVFATLQLSPSAAATWDAALGALGVSWVTTPDPADLIALVALGVSWTVLRPTMRPRRLRPAERATAVVGAGVGLVACVATSPGPRPEPVFGLEFADIEAQAWLHNHTDEPLAVRIRQLASEVRLDCDVLLLEDPGAVLTEDLFLPAVAWELPGNTTVSALADPRDDTPCHAVRVEGDAFDPLVLVWPDTEVQFVPGQVVGARSELWGQVRLPERDDNGANLAFPVRDAPACEAQPGIDRVEWWVPQGEWTLDAFELGADGCIALDLTDSLGSDRGYVCAPADLWPFSVGDLLTIEPSPALLTVSRARDVTTLDLLSGSDDTRLEAFELVGEVDPDRCGLAVDPRCGHVSEDAVVRVTPEGREDEALTLRPGDRKTFAGQSLERLVHVTRAEHRIADDGACDGGLGRTGFEIDVAILQLPLIDDSTPAL
jgi:hypothetical protein